MLALAVPAAWAGEPDLKKTFGQLLPGMGQEQAQQKWQEICWKAAAPGHEAERSLACKLMAEKLGPGNARPHASGCSSSSSGSAAANASSEVAPSSTTGPAGARRGHPGVGEQPGSRGRRRLRESPAAAPRAVPEWSSCSTRSASARGSQRRDRWQRPSRQRSDRRSAAAARALGKIATPDVAAKLLDGLQEAQRRCPAASWRCTPQVGPEDARRRENWTRQEGPRVLCTLQTSRRGSAGWNCV